MVRIIIIIITRTDAFRWYKIRTVFYNFWSLISSAAHGTAAQPDDFIAPSLTPTKYYYALSTTQSPASLPLSSSQSSVPTSSSVITAD